MAVNSPVVSKLGFGECKREYGLEEMVDPDKKRGVLR